MHMAKRNPVFDEKLKENLSTMNGDPGKIYKETISEFEGNFTHFIFKFKNEISTSDN